MGRLERLETCGPIGNRLPIAATSTSEEAYGHTGLIVAGAAIAAEVVGDYLIDPRKIQ